MTKDDESKVRSMIKDTIDKELKKQRDDFEKQILKAIRDSEKTQKQEFLTSLKKEIDALNEKSMTKQQVKDLMIKAFVRQNRFNWEKSKFLTSYFNEL